MISLFYLELPNPWHQRIFSENLFVRTPKKTPHAFRGTPTKHKRNDDFILDDIDQLQTKAIESVLDENKHPLLSLTLFK
jgi:hypothetical protein